MQSFDSEKRIEELNGTMRQSTGVIFNSSGNTFPSPVRPVQQVNGSPISMLGDLSINRPKEILAVNNAELFRRVELQSEGILTKPSMYGKN